jgi:hypothetical protein
MNLKKKTYLALTVKLVFSLTAVQAQYIADSSKNKQILLQPFAAQPIFNKTVSPKQVPGNFYAQDLPFFCSRELKLQKAVGFPIKFRLSTVSYCDKLEGKNQ